MRSVPPVLALLATLACATSAKAPPPPVPMTQAPPGSPGTFTPTGEVVWKDLTGAGPRRVAAFDDWRVRGPGVSLTRSTDGRWFGTFRGADVVLAVTPGKVSGPGVELSLTFDDKGSIVVEGAWGGKPVRMLLAKDRISASFPNGPVELTDMGAGMFNSYQGLLQINGPSDMPQIVLAMLDVMVR